MYVDYSLLQIIVIQVDDLHRVLLQSSYHSLYTEDLGSSLDVSQDLHGYYDSSKRGSRTNSKSSSSNSYHTHGRPILIARALIVYSVDTVTVVNIALLVCIARASIILYKKDQEPKELTEKEIKDIEIKFFL
ncbi:variola B22R-like protein [Magpiepox virus]|nr:variola B22R-like protein [Magpiepox virus]